MIVKKHKNHQGQIVLAICDESLLGKKIEENNLILDLSSNYYKGDKKSDQDLLELIKEAYILNLVGEKSTEFALKNNFINKNNIKKINKIPFAECIFLRD